MNFYLLICTYHWRSILSGNMFYETGVIYQNSYEMILIEIEENGHEWCCVKKLEWCFDSLKLFSLYKWFDLQNLVDLNQNIVVLFQLFTIFISFFAICKHILLLKSKMKLWYYISFYLFTNMSIQYVIGLNRGNLFCGLTENCT